VPGRVGPGYRSAVSRSRIARWFIALTVGAEALALLAEASQRALLDRGVGQITLAEWHHSEVLIGMAAVAAIVLLVIGTIYFLRWLHLSYRNLRELHVHTRFTPGWAVGSFFVPVVNLWRPMQIVDELWRSGDDGKASALIPVWWLLYLGSGIADRIAAAGGADSLADLKRRNLIFGLSHAMALVAGLCLFALVGRLTRRQEETVARLSS
jgi:hypothetical protein